MLRSIGELLLLQLQLLLLLLLLLLLVPLRRGNGSMISNSRQ